MKLAAPRWADGLRAGGVLVGWLAAACLCAAEPPGGRAEGAGAGSPRRPQVHSCYAIDRDGDGYGVGCPAGPDADDRDPTVNTYESVLARHGSIENFVRHLGYNPARIFHGMPKGPLRGGDMVIFKEGTYSGDYPLGAGKLHGSSQRPIVFLAMPGKKVVIQANKNGIDIASSSHLVFDGFILDGGKDQVGSGIYTYWSRNLTFRNLDVFGYGCGLRAMQDLHDILIEDSAFHDCTYSHGIYIGSRELPNTNITVRGCLMYRNNYNGFQHNGRVTNLVLERNVVHSNGLAGVAWLEGVSRSFIRNNLIFNNNTQGIVINLYDDTPTSGIVAYDQVDNLITGNIIWVGRYNGRGVGKTPANHPAILMNDNTAAQDRAMSAEIRGNILVTNGGPTFRMDQRRLLDKTVIVGNIIHCAGAGQKVALLCQGTVYEPAAWENAGGTIKDNVFEDPGFKDASVVNFRYPEKFDFSNGHLSPLARVQETE